MANIAGGSVVWNLDVDDNKFKSKIRGASDNVTGLGNTATKESARSNRAFESVAKVGLAGIAAAAIAAGAIIAKNIGSAVKRVDTLNNFPKVMQNLGYETTESTKALTKLDMGVRGLPTSLDGIASAMQNIAPSAKSLEEATDLTLALNNALIAGGKPAELQATAMEQFSQAIAKGKPDMMEWRSLATAMPGQMKQLSNSLGFSNWQKMADAVTAGDIAFSDVTDAIVKLNKKGLGEFPSFADQAKNSAGGLQTGMANLNTAVARGVAKIIQAVGSDKISKAFGDIGKNIEKTLTSFAGFIKFVEKNSHIFAPILIAISTMIGLLTAWFVIAKALAIAQAVLNAVMAANPIGLFIVLLAGLTTAILYLWNNVEGFRTFWLGVWKTVSSAVDDAVNFVIRKWNELSSLASDVWGTIKSTVVDAFEAVKSTVKDVIDSITGWIKKHQKAIENWAIVIGTLLLPKITQIGLAYIKAGAKATGSFIAMTASAIKNAVLTSVAWTRSAITTGFVWVTQTLPRMIASFALASFHAVMNAMKITAAFVASSASTLLSWGITFARYVAGMAIMVAQTAIAALKMAASWLLAMGPIGLIVALVIGLTVLIIRNWETVKHWFAVFWGWLKSSASSVWGWITGYIRSIVNGIVANANALFNAVKFVADKIGAFFSGAWNWLYGVGKAIIQGLINGIRGMAGRVSEAVGDTAASIKNKFKNLLGIHSPSKVFTGFGQNITQGLANGIDDGINKIQKAAVNMSASVDVTGNDFTGSQGSVGSTNQTVTIGTVVLGNQSAVKSFFEELNQDAVNLSQGLTPVQGVR